MKSLLVTADFRNACIPSCHWQHSGVPGSPIRVLAISQRSRQVKLYAKLSMMRHKISRFLLAAAIVIACKEPVSFAPGLPGVGVV